MAVLLKLLLLICTVEIARAQFPDGDRGNAPTRRLPTMRTSVRFLPRQAARSSAVTPTIVPNPRLRRPIPLKSRPTSEANEIQQVTLPRAKPTFLPTLKSENLSTPPPQLLQQDQPIKPVSEEAREEEEDINQSFIKQLNSLHAFPQPTGSLFSSPLTPKPEPIFQYRPGFNSPVFIPRQIQYQQQQQQQQQQHHHQSSPTPTPTPSSTPTPSPVTQTTLAQHLHEEIIAPVQYRPPKPVKFRKPIDEEETRAPVKQHRKQQQHQQQQNSQSEVISEPQQYRPQADQWRQQPVNKQSSKKAQYREKKPVAQVVRRWREDNSDGSITWGYENDDGSYKEEVIGVDCITRGKYGYIDLDGIKREYTYVTGIKCDEQEHEELQDDLNGFVDYQENKLVFPNGKTIDLSSMGKKQSRRPQHVYRN